MLDLAGPGEDEDPRVRELVFDDLDHNVGRGAEAEEAENLAVLQIRQSQGPVADDARTEKGGRLYVCERLRDRVDGLSGATTYSAYPPSASQPVPRNRTQRFSLPDRQNSQVPSAE